MKRPIPILVASLILLTRGVYAIYEQGIHHYASGLLGNVGTVGCILIVLSAMLYWKVGRWRWGAVAYFMLSLLTSLPRFTKALDIFSLIVIAVQAAVYVWLILYLAGDPSVKASSSNAPPKNEA